MAQGGDGDAGIFDLVPAHQPGQRQIQQPVLVLIDHASVFLPAGEILPEFEIRARRVGRRGAR